MRANRVKKRINARNKGKRLKEDKRGENKRLQKEKKITTKKKK